jgi:hypothetical protein
MKFTLLSGLGILTLATCALLETHALTIEDLSNEPNLAPNNFARHFAHVKFVFAADVQKPEDFLAREAGDCDDYSTLAAAQLAARGYHPRLVSIRMKQTVHVICYVPEVNGYLDYNLRAKGSGIVPCGPDLAEMADAVAKSYKSPWSSVSEFTYGDGVKRLVATTLAKNRSQNVASAKAATTKN